MGKQKVSKSTKAKVTNSRYPVAELEKTVKAENPRYPVAEQTREAKSYGGSARKKMKNGGKMVKGPCS